MARKDTSGADVRTMKAGGPGIAKKGLKKPPMNPPAKKKRRWRPGTVAPRENMMIPDMMIPEEYRIINKEASISKTHV